MPFMPTSRQIGKDGMGSAFTRLIDWLHSSISHAWLALVLLVVYLPVHPVSTPDLSGYPWLYLRDGIALQANERPVEVIFAGDVVIESDLVAEREWDNLSVSWLQNADLAVANFEGAILASSGQSELASAVNKSNAMRHLMLSSAAADLASLGFDLVTLANNHSLDGGSQGLQETVDRLQSNGLDTIGVRDNAASSLSSTPGLVLRQVNGLRLAFLAYTTVVPMEAMPANEDAFEPLIYEPDAAGKAVRTASEMAEVVVVFMHWGEEYALRPLPSQKRIAQDLVAAGADLVIGSHPHVPQTTQVISSQIEPGEPAAVQFVAYSLGNFAFEQPFTETSQGLALRVFLDSQGVRAVQALPVNSGSRPGLISAEQLPDWLKRVLPSGERIVFSCDGQSCEVNEEKPAVQSGVFFAGETDLTGDGEVDQIYRRGSQVFVYENGRQVWKSPGEWQVTDLAIGDPNDDGRSEIILSVRKPDTAGIMRSHPFIVGYRQGAYRLMWGGSAVSEPIRELELADVDADGKQELIVLEDARMGKQTVSVWHWHGWGFTLTWRSESGWYQNLGIINGEDSHPDRFQVEKRWAPAE